MKHIIAAFLFILFTTNIVSAQAKESTAIKPDTPDPNALRNSTPKKRVDLKNLVDLIGKKAPDFISTDLNGTEYNLENLRGKIVVINLWATWCAPCVAEMPELNTLVKKFKNKDVVFLAPTTDDKPILKDFLQKNSFLYQVLPLASDLMRKYSPKEKTESPDVKPRTIQALPTHIVIDLNGIIVKHFWGLGGDKISELSQTIEQLLAARKQ